MTDKLGNGAGIGPKVIATFLAFVCFLMPGLATAQSATDRSAAAAVANYVVQPGDVLSVLIWGWPAQTDKLEGKFPVEANGRVYLPVIGAVQVAGKSTSAVQNDLRTRLAAEQSQATIIIEPLFAVAVNGEVRLPSVYDFRPGQTVFDAVSRAGGYTQDADRKKLLLVRDGVAREMNAGSASELAAQVAQTPLQSGDRLLVYERKRTNITAFLNILQTAIAAVTLYTVLNDNN
jgi:polysaccharide export outer membrane protein